MFVNCKFENQGYVARKALTREAGYEFSLQYCLKVTFFNSLTSKCLTVTKDIIARILYFFFSLDIHVIPANLGNLNVCVGRNSIFPLVVEEHDECNTIIDDGIIVNKNFK